MTSGMKMVWALLLGVSLIGCGKEEIQSYSSAREAPKAVQEMAGMAMESRAAQKPTVTKPKMLWDLPDGWKKEAGQKPMRVATFLVGEDKATVEVVVTQLPSPVGTLLGNVNRWRGQVGLEALTNETFTELARDKKSGFVMGLGIRPDPRLQGYLFDIHGEKTEDSKRMLVALMVDGFQRTW